MDAQRAQEQGIEMVAMPPMHYLNETGDGDEVPSADKVNNRRRMRMRLIFSIVSTLLVAVLVIALATSLTSSTTNTATDFSTSNVVFSVLTNESAIGKFRCDANSKVYDFETTLSSISFQYEADGDQAVDALQTAFSLSQQGGRDVNLQTTSMVNDVPKVVEQKVTENGSSGEVGSLIGEGATNFQDLIASAIGACFVELTLDLGAMGYIAKEQKALEPMMHLSRMFYEVGSRAKFSNESGVVVSSVWDFDRMDAKLTRANIAAEMTLALRSSSSNVKKEPVTLLDNTVFNAQTRAACPATTKNDMFRLGDGNCDADLNIEACNFDNGDCCERTCKPYRNFWGSNSPQDGDDQRHPVFACTSTDGDDTDTCVPSCPIAASARHNLGDGYCDPALNIAACGFDLGDCCDVTCVDRTYECGVNGFNCKSGSSGLCFRNGYCDNANFGMCGRGDSCLKFICGDCYCHFECQDHDRYCSCEGTFTWGCLNVFRDWCDN